ncbi:MAG: MBL fold metallo-hydrolase [Saprospiraceae bacterium]|jgi:glyoxylase-like metal-dependent hydrolase (beta-lactamase superfamily II)|nr:MBL fold metallo-hydrolase [Saprospiraceae bacterium]
MKIQYTNAGITIFESSLYRTTSTVIDFGDTILIVDPNWLPVEVDAIKIFVNTQHKNKKQYLLFTHSDYDHIIGYNAFPDAIVISSVAFRDNSDKAEVLKQICDFDNEFYIRREYPISYPTSDIVIIDLGQKLMIDGYELIFFHSPGHNADGIFTLIPSKLCWIAGDYLSNIEMPFIDFDANMYLNTLHLANQILIDFPHINVLIPGHGDVATSATEIYTRILNDIKYIELLKLYKSDLSAENLLKVEDHIRNYADNPTLLEANQKNIKKLLSI